MSAAALVKEARAQAGLTQRALAARAGTSQPAVARYEAGQAIPRADTLERILLACGRSLNTQASPRASQQARSGGRSGHAGQPQNRSSSRTVSTLADLTTAWEALPSGDQPNWTRLRTVLDHLARHPEDTGRVIHRRPGPSGSAVLDTLLAAIAEKVADDLALTRPAWTRAVPSLAEDWATPGTPAMRAAWRVTTPPQLLARGLIIPGGGLWRSRARARA